MSSRGRVYVFESENELFQGTTKEAMAFWGLTSSNLNNRIRAGQIKRRELAKRPEKSKKVKCKSEIDGVWKTSDTKTKRQLNTYYLALAVALESEEDNE
ncbi:hypothetical protein [Streptococcus sp. zg-JUN1979]|uniref:hypothetical protein n=1 Tax=Streptococcus sp. zg-JUN1979 TaxID=3391450 RepID=UPI0039A73C9B